MKWPHLLAFPLLGVALLAWAQNSSDVSFKSKSGDFAIENIAQQLFQGDAATNSIDFEFSGKPLLGRSNSQNLSFTASHAEGKIRSSPGGNMFLLNATLTGSVAITQNPQGSEFVLKGEKVEYSEAQNRGSATVRVPGSLSIVGQSNGSPIDIRAGGGSVVLLGPAGSARTLSQADLTGRVVADIGSPGPAGKPRQNRVETTGLTLTQESGASKFSFRNAFTFRQSGTDEAGRAQSVMVTGASGSILTPPIGGRTSGRSIRSADIAGRVKITFQGFDRNGEKVDLQAQGDRLTMNANGRILLTGNVELSGNGLDYTSSGASQSVFIQVDENMKPQQYGASGNPSEITFKPGGGR